jgi:hypothetical protein
MDMVTKKRVGNNVGYAEGDEDGNCVTDGMKLGAFDIVGELEGEIEGRFDGAKEGMLVGTGLGAGLSVGCSDIKLVGLKDGRRLGLVE